MNWAVHKFGGTSVGNADCILKCVDIVIPEMSKNRIAMVVSAMGGKPKVTDLLLDIVHAAAANKMDEVSEKCNTIRAKHRECAQQLFSYSPQLCNSMVDIIEKDLSDIMDLLRAVRMMKTAHEQILELVSGYGEIWSATIIAAYLKLKGLPFVFLNARDVLVVGEYETVGTKVFWEESDAKLQEFLAPLQQPSSADNCNVANNATELPHLIITGYIASTMDGVATTLKRDGSDFSASIFGKLLQATSITIWTDVSGVYSADPRRVPEAQIIQNISYSEAIELAYFGAKVIHPKTMAPAIEAKIPILIRNTFEPTHEGTKIFHHLSENTQRRESTVCGFTTVDGISLLNLEGTGMIGVPGIAHRLFGALKSAGVSVLFIAQASSEHSICFAIKTVFALKAKEAIEKNFFYEMKHKFVNHIRIIDECSIIAAIGESMSHMPGVSGLFFGALGGAAVNILSISQGCDERNISAVVYTKDTTRALRAVHAAFLLSSLDISIGVVGTGRVGSALLQTLLEQLQILSSRFGLKIRVRGIANSRNMILGEDITEVLKGKMAFFGDGQSTNGSKVKKSHSNISLQDLEATMAAQEDDRIPTDLTIFTDHLRGGSTPHSIIIDTTTSAEVARLHPFWLQQGCHVVTANKRSLSKGLDLYNAVFNAARSANRMFMSEVTIGASLPIRTTLNDILCSGDAVHAIVGIMSVSLGVILTDICDEGKSFSDAVVSTFKRGLFEDDPFVDLEGTEAAEKLLILAREMGIPLRLEDIEIEPLARRQEVVSWTNLGDMFQQEDEYMRRRAEAAKQKGCTLRYVQRIECSPPAELGYYVKSNCKVSVKLEEVPLGSMHAMVRGPVYHFSFHTERFAQNPLIIQGPLSDSANTASGIVGDILRIARSLGAKDKGPAELRI